MYCIAVQRVIKRCFRPFSFFCGYSTVKKKKKKIKVVLALACLTYHLVVVCITSIVIYIILIVASPALIKDCSSVQGLVL